jgi:16S rRNA (cytosine967-C5)-methyltransferase
MQRSLARPVRLCCRRTYVSRTAPVCAAEPVAPPSAEQKEQRLAANQLRTAGSLLSALAPHVRSDASLALRVRDLAGERRFNSSSRRLYRELLFAAVRHWAWVETLLASGGQSGESNAAAAVAYLADETPEVRRLRSANEASLAALGARSGRELGAARDALQRAFPAAALCTPDELAAPDWFRAQVTAATLPPPEVALSRAPLYIRVQQPGAEAALRDELARLGVSVRVVPQLLGAWELQCSTPDVDLVATEGYQAGAFEVQDLGSQTLLAVVAPEAGGSWLDACAGAGGKTLQLAALLGPRGRVTACDVREEALRELRRRARRARLEDRITTLPCDWAAGGADTGLFDGVLVDAPCTGSGTWRRQPHLRWLLTPEAVDAAAQRQLNILHAAAKRVRPGGLLVYATCSLADAENGGVADAFLNNAPFEAVPLLRASALGLAAPDGRLTISPALLDSDGFFLAAMRRTG